MKILFKGIWVWVDERGFTIEANGAFFKELDDLRKYLEKL